jgi:hypothetical protein
VGLPEDPRLVFDKTDVNSVFSSASLTSDKKHNFFASSRLGVNKIIEGLPAKGRLKVILAKPHKPACLR